MDVDDAASQCNTSVCVNASFTGVNPARTTKTMRTDCSQRRDRSRREGGGRVGGVIPWRNERSLVHAWEPLCIRCVSGVQRCASAETHNPPAFSSKHLSSTIKQNILDVVCTRTHHADEMPARCVRLLIFFFRHPCTNKTQDDTTRQQQEIKRKKRNTGGGVTGAPPPLPDGSKREPKK